MAKYEVNLSFVEYLASQPHVMGHRLLKCTQITNIDSQQWRPLPSPLAI